MGIQSKVYKSKKLLTRHLVDFHGEKPYKCDTCDSQFKSRTGLTWHKQQNVCEKRLPIAQSGIVEFDFNDSSVKSTSSPADFTSKQKSSNESGSFEPET